MEKFKEKESKGTVGNLKAPAKYLAPTLILTSIIVFLALLWRIRFGVDFVDEAWYLTNAFRLWMGDRPFIDEKNLAQTMGFLLSPCVGLYYKFTGSLDGLFLYMRILYVLFVFCVGGITFTCLRKVTSLTAAGIGSLLYICFIPLGITALSYYTMGAGFFLVALFVDAYQGRSFLAGILISCAAIAYPPLVIFLPLKFLHLLTKGKKEALLFLLAVMFPVGLVLFSFKINPAEFFRYVITLNENGGVYTSKLSNAGHAFDFLFSVLGFLVRRGTLVLIGSLYLALKLKTPAPLRLFLLLAPLPVLIILNKTGSGGLGPTGIILTIAPLALLRLIHFKKNRRYELGLIWVPSILAGLILGTLSTNGFHAVCLGWIPAFLLSICFWIECVEEVSPKAALPSFLILILAFCSYFRSVYNDEKVNDLVAKVNFGPYRGLYTVPIKQRFLSELQADLARLPSGFDSIFLGPSFPIGYLLLPYKPTGLSTWDVCNGREFKACFDNASKAFTERTLVLLLNWVPYKQEYFETKPSDPRDFRFYSSFQQPPLIEKPNYGFYRAIKSGK